MIKCLYCGYECPDTAQTCPNCSKPIFRLPLDNAPNYNELAKALLRENDQKQKEPLAQKHAVIAACVVLILALVAYTIFAR